MSNILIAIDPGSNSFGAALFLDRRLVSARTFVAKKSKESLSRFCELSCKFLDWIDEKNLGYSTIKSAVLEDPLLRGKANNVMQRFIGFLSHDLITYCDLAIPPARLSFVHPSTVKSRFSTIDKDKLAVAAYHELDELEKLVINDLINQKEWDATDAVAIGLTHLRRTPHDRNNGSGRSADSAKDEKGKRQNKKKKAVKGSRKGVRSRQVKV